MHHFAGRFAQLAILVAALLSLAPPANGGPAGDIIGKLNTVFIDVMQNAKSLGYEGATRSSSRPWQRPTISPKWRA